MKNISNFDKEVIRDLAKSYLELCESDRNRAAHNLWNDHNSFKKPDHQFSYVPFGMKEKRLI